MKAYSATRVTPGSIRNGVRMALERQSLDKVDEVMLARGPSVSGALRQVDSDTDRVVGQSFDMAACEVPTISGKHDGKADEH